MPDILPGARPTRMELIARPKRRNIAQRGQDLLREKLDALMIEFFQFAREITALRVKTQDILNRTYLRFAGAQMLMGSTRLEETSLTAQDRFDVDASTRNVIGVSIPDVEVQLRPLEGYPYSMIGTSAKLDEAVALKIGRAHVELQSPDHLVCRLLLEKKNTSISTTSAPASACATSAIPGTPSRRRWCLRPLLHCRRWMVLSRWRRIAATKRSSTHSLR